MADFNEVQISQAIIESYYKKLSQSLSNDVLIVGAGPSGLVAGYYLAKKGLKVTIIEKRLSTGGGIWGGGIGMNQVIVQDDALIILDEFTIRHIQYDRQGLYIVDAIELASALTLKALQAGVSVLNLITFEDLCIHNERVTGIVVNRTMIHDNLPVDPITFAADAVIDATGHEAVAIESLRKRNLLTLTTPDGKPAVEGPMNALAGEKFVIENVQEVYPGLWVSGMSVCATFAGPRMGPIFGGMLLSGKRVAELIATRLK